MTNCRKRRALRKARTAAGSSHPSSPIISLAATLVKHFLPNFFGSGGSAWEIHINYIKSNDADNRVPLFFSFPHLDKAKAERFAAFSQARSVRDGRFGLSRTLRACEVLTASL
jgi:hypothetical protein